MNISVVTPFRSAVVGRGIQVDLAPLGEKWSELPVGELRSSVGVYVIHHDGLIKYVGKTSGRTMNFGKRLRRHFQQSAAGRHTYPRLAAIDRPPPIQVSLYDYESLSQFVSYRGQGNPIDRDGVIQLFEAAMIIALKPEFQLANQ